MSVLLDTTLGELVVDLFVDECPLAATNFLKLCKTKYYNNVLFFNVQENFMVQTGDPTGTGQGGISLYGQLYGDQAKYFEDEIVPHRKFDRKGLVALANQGAPHTNGAQFFITTRSDDLAYLDGKHTIMGEIAEGMDVLDKINALFVDKDYRPYQDVRIRHTYVLEDPFPDPALLQVPPASPMRDRPEQETVDVRLAADEALDDNQGRTEEEIEQSLREKEAKSRAVVLEMIGDLPDADVKPPDEVLFVCKLNPVTESSDLDMAFCRFGPCKADVIRDYKTGDSLCFAFVEFQDRRHCEEAYFKMNNVLLDDRRIKVDFSQSVSKLWNKVKRRPWEKNSKADGDPYTSEKRSGGSGGGRGGGRRGGPDVGKNLRLKQPPPNRGGAEFDLVGSDDEGDRKRDSRGDRCGSERPRDKRTNDDRSSRSRSRKDSTKNASSASGSRDKRRSRDRDTDRPMEGDRRDHHHRGNSRDRGRDRDRNRDRERDSKRDRARDSDHGCHSERDRDRSPRDHDRSSKKSRRSRSVSRDRGSSRRH